MKVFLSHSFQDEELARGVGDALRAAGLDVWDDSQVFPGDNWAEQLGRALQQSEAMVILLTPNSLQSANVSHDLGFALGKKEFKGRVIPVLAAPAEQLPREQIPWVLQKFPMINLADLGPEEASKRIARASPWPC